MHNNAGQGWPCRAFRLTRSAHLKIMRKEMGLNAVSTDRSGSSHSETVQWTNQDAAAGPEANFTPHGETHTGDQIQRVNLIQRTHLNLRRSVNSVLPTHQIANTNPIGPSSSLRAADVTQLYQFSLGKYSHNFASGSKHQQTRVQTIPIMRQRLHLTSTRSQSRMQIDVLKH